jgi:hypothetical protein
MKITAVSFDREIMPYKVYVTTDDGKTHYLFTYYPDELSFTAGELIGLTIVEAHELRHKKDLAYLRS